MNVPIIELQASMRDIHVFCFMTLQLLLACVAYRFYGSGTDRANIHQLKNHKLKNMYDQDDNTLIQIYLLRLDKFTDTISLWSSSLFLAVFRFLRDDLIVAGAQAPAAGAIAPASEDLSAIFVVPSSCCVSAVKFSAGGDL